MNREVYSVKGLFFHVRILFPTAHFSHSYNTHSFIRGKWEMQFLTLIGINWQPDGKMGVRRRNITNGRDLFLKNCFSFLFIYFWPNCVACGILVP